MDEAARLFLQTPMSTDAIFSHLKRAAVPFLLLLLVAGTAGTSWYLYRRSEELHEYFPLQGSALELETVRAFRQIYTEDVVTPAQHLGLEITHDPGNRKRAIPLPATMTNKIGERLNEFRPGAFLRLYSDQPFPWSKDGGVRDDFERDAMLALRATPDKPFYRFEEYRGRRSLRYAVADRMQASCVNCHNSHPDSPKRDWQVGDVRGVLEFVRPLDQEVARGQAAFRNGLIFTVGMIGLGLTGLGLVYRRLRQTGDALAAGAGLTRAILESALDGVIAMDHEGRILEFNAAAEMAFGYTRAEVIGRPVSELIIPPSSRESHNQGLARFLATGESRILGKRIEVTAQRADGTEFPVELAIRATKQLGSPVFTAFLRDLTEPKRLETQLRHAQKLESIGQLAAGVAHEINTPIQYVTDNNRFLQDSFVELEHLLRKYDQVLAGAESSASTDALAEQVVAARRTADLDYLIGEIPKAIEQSLEGLNRVATIVRAMKEFSHPGANERTPTDLNRCIESTLVVAGHEWKYAADIQTDLDPQLPLVPCYPNDINQVILNLVVNAAHAIADAPQSAPAGKGTITVATRRTDDGVEIRVSDTGTGIPEHVQPRIFDPFFTTKEVGRGTGQGLAIAYSVIVKRHGGSIRFETQPGRGTTFIVRLPLDAVPTRVEEASV
jgi:PAS domain S-box-containing protein